MTSPSPSGGTSPTRIAGLAMLGVGAVAGLIGIATVATNSGGQPEAGPPAPSSATSTLVPAPAGPTPAEPVPGAAPPGDSGVPVPSFEPTPTNAIAEPPPNGAPAPAPAPNAAPGPAAAGVGDGAGGGTPVVKAPLRVYNNSTIHGLAARAADDFRNAGWAVEQVANYPSGIIPTSTVYYRPGTNEQVAAKSLGSQFGMRVEERFAGLNDASPGLIVIVTNDYKRP